VSDNDDSFSILRDEIMCGVQKFHIDNVTETFQLVYDLVEVPAILIKEAADILKHPNFRLQFLHGCNKRRETVS